MGVNACCGVRDVCGESEVREPQVLNVGVPERLMDKGVEPSTRKHGHLWVGQVEHHPPDLRHFLWAKNRRNVFFYCHHHLFMALVLGSPHKLLLRKQSQEKGLHSSPVIILITGYIQVTLDLS